MSTPKIPRFGAETKAESDDLSLPAYKPATNPMVEKIISWRKTMQNLERYGLEGFADQIMRLDDKLRAMAPDHYATALEREKHDGEV